MLRLRVSSRLTGAAVVLFPFVVVAFIFVVASVFTTAVIVVNVSFLLVAVDCCVPFTVVDMLDTSAVVVAAETLSSSRTLSMTSCASMEGSKVSWLLKGVLLFIFFESVCFVISLCPADVRSAARISASATERCFLSCGLA